MKKSVPKMDTIKINPHKGLERWLSWWERGDKTMLGLTGQLVLLSW